MKGCWLGLVLGMCGSLHAEWIEGRIQSVSGQSLLLKGKDLPSVRLSERTEIMHSNTWHSLEAVPGRGITAELQLDPDLDQAVEIGPEVLERAHRDQVIAVNRWCLRVTSEDRVDHQPTGDYPVWVGTLKKKGRDGATLTVEDRTYQLEFKTRRQLGWFYAEVKQAALKPGMQVVVSGTRNGNALAAERVLITASP